MSELIDVVLALLPSPKSRSSAIKAPPTLDGQRVGPEGREEDWNSDPPGAC